MKKPDIISNLIYSLERKIGWCPKPPTTESRGVIYHRDYGQKLRLGRLHIFGKPHIKTIHLTLFLTLVLMGTPTLINYRFSNTFYPPDLFPFYSFRVISVELSDHIITVENGSFRSQAQYATNYVFLENGSVIPLDYPLFFTTKVEVKTKTFYLDASQIVDVNYYWLSMDKNRFPFGDYYASLEYQDANSNITIDKVYSRLLNVKGMSQIRENEDEYPVPSFMSIPPSIERPGSGFQLPKASKDEYIFKLVAYTNATVKPDEAIARFVPVYRYKSSITIMGYRINLETIGYMTLLSPFAILAVALMFQIIRRRRNRFHGSTNLIAEKLFSGAVEQK